MFWKVGLVFDGVFAVVDAIYATPAPDILRAFLYTEETILTYSEVLRCRLPHLKDLPTFYDSGDKVLRQSYNNIHVSQS